MNVQPRVNRTECALLRPGPHQPPEQPVEREFANRITESDRAAIARYYEGRWPRVKGPRLHGRTRPRKRWIIGSRLPAGLRTSPLPRELEQTLSLLEPGYERVVAGAEILCIDTATARIVDVMRGGGSQKAEDTPQLLLDYPSAAPLPASS
jgi:hypothetical protein